MSTHTLMEPWRAVMPLHHDDLIVIASADGQALFATRNTAIANLVAAAPELLEALERAKVKMLAYVGVCTGDKELTDEVLPMARAAIAKATGGAV